MLGISVGIAAVIMLTSIGEGIHKFILAEFTQFGTTIVKINPGKPKPWARRWVFLALYVHYPSKMPRR